jgi:hypothetical protein
VAKLDCGLILGNTLERYCVALVAVFELSSRTNAIGAERKIPRDVKLANAFQHNKPNKKVEP